MIKTEAGEKMKKENPNKELPEKADINKDGEFQAWEKARHEAIQAAKAEDTPEMNMGGLMGDGMGVIIGIEAESGNEIPAGSKPEEVADDIPAMLSEGEYVVPADVVRWHGVKTFEELRCEAKMGMGLMAQDGRIAEVSDEYEHGHDSPDYDIEEKDKPKVEKAEVEVVHAAEGVDVSPVTPAGGPYYGYKVVYDPVARRYVYRAVDPETKEYVTTQDFDPTKSTRYTPESLLGGVYGEEETTECPEGFYFDEEAGVCMPEEAPALASAVQPDGGGGDGPPVDQPPTPYNYQLSTMIADKLGPLSAEDLEDYEGLTLADRALSRATEDRGIGPVQAGLAVAGGPLGVAGLAGKQIYNEVGAKRAAMTRQNQLGIEVEDLLGDQEVLTTRMSPTYNLSFDPNKAAFNATSSTTISELQRSDSGSAWASDYVHTDSSGNERDPFSSDSAFNDVMDAIDNDFSSLSEVTGASQGNKPSGGVSVSVTTGDGSQTSTSSTSSGRGTEGSTPGGAGPQSGGTDSSSDTSASSVGGEDDNTSGSFAKGGYVSKKNKPKMATMQYSKGSK